MIRREEDSPHTFLGRTYVGKGMGDKVFVSD